MGAHDEPVAATDATGKTGYLAGTLISVGSGKAVHPLAAPQQVAEVAEGVLVAEVEVEVEVEVVMVAAAEAAAIRVARSSISFGPNRRRHLQRPSISSRGENGARVMRVTRTGPRRRMRASSRCRCRA